MPSDFVKGNSTSRVTLHAEINTFKAGNPRSKTRSIIAEPMHHPATLLTHDATLVKSFQSFTEQDSGPSLKRKAVDDEDDPAESQAAKRFRKSEKKRRKRERRAARVAQLAEQSILDTDVMLPTEPTWQMPPNHRMVSPFNVMQDFDEWSLPLPLPPWGAHTAYMEIPTQSRFEFPPIFTDSDPSSQNVDMVPDYEQNPLPDPSLLQMLPPRPNSLNDAIPLPPIALDAGYASSARPQKTHNPLHHRVIESDIAAKQDLLDRTISQNKEALVHLSASLTKEQKAGVMKAIGERNKLITQLTSEIKSHFEALKVDTRPTPPKAAPKFKWPETEFPLCIIISTDEDELCAV
ncbi:hypothetical protein BU17DRAFT_63271 [Hysterangium stoloniferum]|nr:hypothetical protein BU17DRAFT_63271 [Hysterangium stoloniferum]